ncbi:MAG: tetratricopeptide repeat protein [Xanthomonadales bacterium]|nr:tetratricopeptide repeat protein [Xanthomonadales bacterium]
MHALLRLRAYVAGQLQAQFRIAEASAEADEILRMVDLVGTVAPSEVLASLATAALIRETAGDLESSLKIARRASEIAKSVYGEQSSPYAASLARIAGALGKMGRQQERLDANRSALKIAQHVYSSGSPALFTYRYNLGLSLLDSGAVQEANESASSLLSEASRVRDPLTFPIFLYRKLLAATKYAAGECALAKTIDEETVAMFGLVGQLRDSPRLAEIRQRIDSTSCIAN